MSIIAVCRSCREEYTLKANFEGKRVRCKNCGETFIARHKYEEEIPTVPLADEDEDTDDRPRDRRRGRSAMRDYLDDFEDERRSRSDNEDYDDGDYDDEDDPDEEEDPIARGIAVNRYLVLLFFLTMNAGAAGICFYVFNIGESTAAAAPNNPVASNQPGGNGGGPGRPDWNIPKDKGGGGNPGGHHGGNPGGSNEIPGFDPNADPSVRVSLLARSLNQHRTTSKLALERLFAEPKFDAVAPTVTSELTKYLNQSTNQHRVRAVQVFERWGTPIDARGLHGVVQAGSHDDVAKEAIRVLGKWKSKDSLTLVILQLRNARRREVAKQALIEWGAEASQELSRYTADPRPDMRQAVKETLEAIGSPDDGFVRSMLGSLGNPDPEEVDAALETLRGVKPVDDLRKGLFRAMAKNWKNFKPGTDAIATEVLIKWYSADQRDEVTKLLQMENPNLLDRALLVALVKSDDPKSILTVVTGITNPDLKSNVEYALKQGGGGTETVILQTIPSLPDMRAKIELIQVLGAMGGQKSVVGLAALGARDRRLRTIADVTRRQIVRRLTNR